MENLQYRLLHALVDEVCDAMQLDIEPSENTIEVLTAAFECKYPAGMDMVVKALRNDGNYKDTLDLILGTD